MILFGLTNSFATFQAFMNTIFANLVAAGKVAVYLDDILIYTATPEEHQAVTHDILQCLSAHNLYLHSEKCEFAQDQIEYLELIIQEGKVFMDLVKIHAVVHWPTPCNLRNLQGFLGFANFYCHFIKDFAKLACPLNDLTKKNVSWTWGTLQKHAFQALKDKFSHKPILTMWEPHRPTCLKVDVSGYAMGSVLLQKLDDNLLHPIAFQSQSMIDAEHNYKIYDK